MNKERFRHYKLGYEAIDNEHLEILILMDDAMIASKDRDIPKLNECLNHIKACLTDHFNHEETLMDKIDYPYKAWHKEVHARVSNSLSETFNRYTQNKNSVAAHIALTRELEKIIAHHVDETDRQLVEYLNK